MPNDAPPVLSVRQAGRRGNGHAEPNGAPNPAGLPLAQQRPDLGGYDSVKPLHALAMEAVGDGVISSESSYLVRPYVLVSYQ